MRLGILFATSNAFAARLAAEAPSSTVSSDLLASPRTRETRVPEAMTAVARASPDRARGAAGALTAPPVRRPRARGRGGCARTPARRPSTNSTATPTPMPVSTRPSAWVATVTDTAEAGPQERPSAVTSCDADLGRSGGDGDDGDVDHRPLAGVDRDRDAGLRHLQPRGAGADLQHQAHLRVEVVDDRDGQGGLGRDQGDAGPGDHPHRLHGARRLLPQPTRQLRGGPGVGRAGQRGRGPEVEGGRHDGLLGRRGRGGDPAAVGDGVEQVLHAGHRGVRPARQPVARRVGRRRAEGGGQRHGRGPPGPLQRLGDRRRRRRGQGRGPRAGPRPAAAGRWAAAASWWPGAPGPG